MLRYYEKGPTWSSQGPLFLSNSVKPTQIHQIQQVSNPEAKKLVYFINKGHVIDLAWKRG